jgi:hypothetical protein
VKRGKQKRGKHKRHQQGIQGWSKMVICLTLAVGVTAGAGHITGGPAPQPTRTCVELQALSCRTGLVADASMRAAGSVTDSCGAAALVFCQPYDQRGRNLASTPLLCCRPLVAEGRLATSQRGR